MLRGVTVLITALTVEGASAQAGTQALAPAAAVSKFQVEDGFRIELVAAEPLVQSPAAIAWDEANRLFVAENMGYPIGPKRGEQPAGKIVELRDENGDGKADKRVEFATGLQFPNGLLPWRGGWLVTDAPNLYWLADTNRDGRADVQEIWFTGFETNQSTQLRACYPVLGPDGWIYVARGLSAGKVSSPKWTNLPVVDLKDGDFRFRPDGSKAEAIGGNAQFGMVIDDVGRRFLTSNRKPIMHAVAWPHWWKRMTNFYFGEITEDVSPVGADARVYPISADLTTSGFMPELMSAPHAGTFTSACGLHQFFGEALPVDYQGNWFICEPAQNLVQRQIATQNGATFKSRRATEGKDFLASSDPWFRPVFTATGPDGALFIADMYRNFIDHPEYLPTDARDKVDFDAGKERGRIWKVFSEQPKSPEPLTNVSPAQLARALRSDNIWRRETAHRLIIEAPSDAVIAPLLSTFERIQGDASRRDTEEWLSKLRSDRKKNDPAFGPHLGRARTVHLLADLSLHHRNKLGVASMHPAFRRVMLATFDPSPAVREAVFRVIQLTSERRNPIPEVPLEYWLDDPNPAVLFHLAYSLGHGAYNRMTDGLVSILRRGAGDRWTRAVVLSGLSERMHQFAVRWFAREWAELPGLPQGPFGFDDSEGSVMLASEIGRVYGAENVNGAEVFLQHAFAHSADGSGWQPALLTGFLEAGNTSLRERFRDHADERVAKIEAACATNALNSTLPAYTRTAAINFLGEVQGRGREALLKIVRGPHLKNLQVAAARALVKSEEMDLPEIIFQDWRALTAELREIFLQYLLSKPSRTVLLLDAVERGEVPAWNINAHRRATLIKRADANVSKRAEMLLGERRLGDRRQVFEELKSVLNLQADPAKGRSVFLNVCASCHRRGKDGHTVGPDLTGVKNQPAEALLYHIVLPDAEVYPGYQTYEVEMKSGEHFDGLLLEENDSTVTLVRALGEKQRIERAKVERIRVSASSLMPSELERAMTRQDLTDLIAFLKSDH